MILLLIDSTCLSHVFVQALSTTCLGISGVQVDLLVSYCSLLVCNGANHLAKRLLGTTPSGHPVLRNNSETDIQLTCSALTVRETLLLEIIITHVLTTTVAQPSFRIWHSAASASATAGYWLLRVS